MSKLHDARSEPHNAGDPRLILWFHCPGCQNAHAFLVPQWTWNGSMEAPTFQPSLMCNMEDPKSRCHSIVTDGKIAFQSDCYHAMAGQTVEIPDWEGWER